jgi:hypothetical protein
LKEKKHFPTVAKLFQKRKGVKQIDQLFIIPPPCVPVKSVAGAGRQTGVCMVRSTAAASFNTKIGIQVSEQ